MRTNCSPSCPDLDVVYVPIGMGSGICGLITVRDLLGLKTEIVGVVAENAPAFALSFEAGRPIRTNSAQTFADGLACRDPQPDALEIIAGGAARVVTVSEADIAEAIRIYYLTTHNLAEGAGAAPLAALLKAAKSQRRQAGRPDPHGWQYRHAGACARSARRNSGGVMGGQCPASELNRSHDQM